jgi:hypothetical protein
MHPARYTIKQIVKKHRRVVGGIHDMKKDKTYPLKGFLVDLKDDWPQLSDFFKIFSNNQELPLTGKVKVLIVMLIVKMMRIFERIRLWVGANSLWG